jgi:hypothetical protein
MLLLSIALAAPADRLHAAAALLEDAPVHTGLIRHQGHDATPGATREHAFVASTDGAFAQ